MDKAAATKTLTDTMTAPSTLGPYLAGGRAHCGVKLDATLEWSKVNPQCLRGRGTFIYRGARWRVELRQLHLGFLHEEAVSYADIDGRLLVVREDGSGKPPTPGLLVEAKVAFAELVDREATARGAY